jgi:hypothetical protein
VGASERRALIADSGKPDCAVIDFAGNAGKHTLVTPEDILGGNYTDDEVKLAKKLAKETPGLDVIANLEAARRALKAMMRRIESKVTATVEEFSPFTVLHMKAVGDKGSGPINRAQVEELTKHRVRPDHLEGLSQAEAQKLLVTLRTRSRLGLCSFNQLRTLQKYCDPPVNLTMRQASRALTYLNEVANWNPDRAVLQKMVTIR